MTEKKFIEKHTFADFVRAFEEAVSEGFRVDWDTNKNYPMNMIGSYRAGMIKEQPTEIKAVGAPKRGRPKSKE